MAELQERRRSLQTLLSSRLAELRRVCLQEAVSDVIALTPWDASRDLSGLMVCFSWLRS